MKRLVAIAVFAAGAVLAQPGFLRIQQGAGVVVLRPRPVPVVFVRNLGQVDGMYRCDAARGVFTNVRSALWVRFDTNTMAATFFDSSSNVVLEAHQ